MKDKSYKYKRKTAIKMILTVSKMLFNHLIIKRMVRRTRTDLSCKILLLKKPKNNLTLSTPPHHKKISKDSIFLIRIFFLKSIKKLY